MIPYLLEFSEKVEPNIFERSCKLLRELPKKYVCKLNSENISKTPKGSIVLEWFNHKTNSFVSVEVTTKEYRCIMHTEDSEIRNGVTDISCIIECLNILFE